MNKCGNVMRNLTPCTTLDCLCFMAYPDKSALLNYTNVCCLQSTYCIPDESIQIIGSGYSADTIEK